MREAGIEEAQLGLLADRAPSMKSKLGDLPLVDTGRGQDPLQAHTSNDNPYPETVHYGHAADVIDAGQVVLLEAYASHPERFVNAAPRPPELPEARWCYTEFRR